MPYENEHSIRLQDPGKFDDKSFRRTHGSGKGKVQGVKIPKTIDVIWAKLKGKSAKTDPVIAQALRFPVSGWKKDDKAAKKWISDNEVKGTFEAAALSENELLTNVVELEPIDGWKTFAFVAMEEDPDSFVFSNPIEIRVNLKTEDYRYEDWMGSNHLVVPATILVEGVHNKLFYSADELKNSAHLWNGIPIPIYHPKDENGIPTSANTPEITSQCAGRFWNTTFDPKVKGLKGEFWLDTKKFGGDILDKILNGQMEISTGLWSDEEAGEGDWNGEKYIASLSNYRPDHVAILPNEIGACSWEDGCGIRVNSSDENPYRKEEQNIVKNELNLLKKGDKFKVILMAVNGEEGTLKTLLKTLGKGLGLKVQELSHDDIRQQLNEQIRAKFKTPTNQYPDVWVRDVWDDHLVYESGSKKYDQSYSLAADEVEITGDPIEVKLKSSYVPVVSKTSGSGITRANEEDEGTGDDDILNNEDVDDDKEDPNKSKTKKEEVVIMARKETVNKLIENKKFSEEDRVWLDALEDEQFDKVAKLAGLEDDPDADDPDADADEDVDADDLDTNADKDKEKDAPVKKAATPEEFLANSEMPSEVRDVLTSGLKMQKAKKAGYVKRILSREGNTFTQNQLAAKSIDELESLVALIGDEVDFSGGPGGPGPKEPNLNEKQEDGSGVPKPLRPEFKDGKPIIP